MGWGDKDQASSTSPTSSRKGKKPAETFSETQLLEVLCIAWCPTHGMAACSLTLSYFLTAPDSVRSGNPSCWAGTRSGRAALFFSSQHGLSALQAQAGNPSEAFPFEGRVLHQGQGNTMEGPWTVSFIFIISVTINAGPDINCWGKEIQVAFGSLFPA